MGMLPTYCTDLNEYREWIKSPPAIYDNRDQPHYEKVGVIQLVDSDEIAEWIRDFDGNQSPQDAARIGVREPNLEEVFREYADQWERETASISSVTALTSHPKYQEIVNLGWPVVPYLLADLKNKRGYWFNALYEITKIRPFDPGDAGNSKRMVEAWLNWGKMKKIQF
jgi:hypothetical protein